MTFGLGTLVFFVALSASGPGNHAKGKASGPDDSIHVPAVKDRLPSKVELKEALGMASELLEQQRQKLIKERHRLEELRAEIKGEIKRLTKLQHRMKNNGANTPNMPTVGTSLGNSSDEAGQRAKEKLSKQQATERKGRLKHVAKSLASMSPKAAAVAISKMNDRLAVELLSVVDGKKVGKIFEAMSPGRAAVLMQKVVEVRAGVSPRVPKKGAS